VALGLACAGGVATSSAGAGKEAKADRVANLIRQLGDDEFEKREAASKELEAIGAPALDALRKAASHDDSEIRRRAEQILQAVTGRIRAAAAKKELARWQGDWSGAAGEKLAIQGNQWVSSTPTFGPVSGTFKDIDVREKMTLVDLVVEAGPTKGRTAKVIFRIDGDTLHYCGTYDAASPTDFKTQGTNVYIAWKRGKIPPAPAVAQPAPPPADVQYKGKIAEDEAKVKTQSGLLPAKRFEVRLQAGKAYRLTMTSPDFDSFLVLQDKTGKELASDDDSGGGLNSLILYTPDSDGKARWLEPFLCGKRLRTTG
jgi:uncharacterized protein (TIGR03067 family)